MYIIQINFLSNFNKNFNILLINLSFVFDNIGLHIKNILSSGELDITTTEEYSVVQQEGNRKVKRTLKFYNLDMIISVGYRVNSKKGILFRKWASNILKKYLIEGYVVNEKRLSYLEKQINLISIASRLDDKLITDEGNKILETTINYNKALSLLDDYDHQTISKPEEKEIIIDLIMNFLTM